MISKSLVGSIIIAFTMGFIISYAIFIGFENEMKTTTMDFGSGTVTIYPEGKTVFHVSEMKTILTNEKIVSEMLADGITYTMFSDGSIVTEYVGGTKFALFSDGRFKVQAFPDDNNPREPEIEKPIITEGEDKKIGTFSDGTIIWIWDNGDVSKFNPPDANGIIYTEKKWADGVKAFSCRSPNGDKETTINYPDGTRSVIDKNGHTKHYDKNGKLKWQDGI